MRIGIDGLPLTESLAGIGHYTLELVRHLCRHNEVDVISPKPFLPSLTANQQEDWYRCLTQKKVNPITGRWWSFGLPRYLRKSGLDVFHGTNFEIPLRRVCASVITIHDLSLLLHPKTHPQRRVWRAKRRLPWMARRATMIITVSEAIRSEVHQYLKIPLDRIVTVHSAARELFHPMETQKAEQIRSSLKVKENFILYAGTIEPRKNLSKLVEAFDKSGLSRDLGLQLVLAGKKGWLVEDFHKSVTNSPIGRNVFFTGYLNDEELCALYSTCRVFVYPSLYEGFGLPPLEAMACGAPVIASRIRSISEVVGSAAFLVYPHSSVELANAMNELVRNNSRRKELIAAGQSRVRQFSWAKTAENTRDVYIEAIDRFKRQNGKSIDG